jgi:hypothetical protein
LAKLPLSSSSCQTGSCVPASPLLPAASTLARRRPLHVSPLLRPYPLLSRAAPPPLALCACETLTLTDAARHRRSSPPLALARGPGDPPRRHDLPSRRNRATVPEIDAVVLVFPNSGDRRHRRFRPPRSSPPPPSFSW